MEPKCKSCKHGIFDEKWGEWKCRVHEHRIYNPETKVNCSYFEQKKKEKTDE